jgi:hypothetical protein
MERGRGLWIMGTAVATVYPIERNCNRDALRKLLSEGFRRVLTSDRHKSYDHVAPREITIKEQL